MASVARAELISASEKDAEQLSTIVQRLSEESKLQDTLADFNKRQLEDLWDGTLQICMSSVLNNTDDQDIKEMTNVLNCITTLAASTMAGIIQEKGKGDGDQEHHVVHGLQETIIILHGLLPTLTTDAPQLSDKLSSLFENWWLNNLPSRQEVVGNTLIYLVTRCTEEKASQKIVMRLWKVHSMLSSMDLSARSSSRLITLLLKCLHHHQFITTPPGLKFLAFLFTLSPTLTDKLHVTMKVNLLATPKSWHSKYGEIYFRAWQKVTDDDLKVKIEQNCIQDLMNRAIHGQRGGQGATASVLFKLLNYIHKQKSQRGVESMLTQLYAPILWRSMKVANSDVRVNAATLMFDVFPLQSPDMNVQEADELLQRQFDVMHDLLLDTVPDVRITAIKGVGRVLFLYWELIPTQVIQSLVTTLIQDLAYDISTPLVREAVVKVMFQLCDNHLCIPMLKKVLPELKNFVHDTSEKVRLAMFDLLLKVKGLRAIKFYSIVPVEHILARLEIDSWSIARRIMKLLHPSFVPKDQPPQEQLNRLLTLIKGHPGASRQFFLHLPQHVALTDCVNAINLLCRYAMERVRHEESAQSSNGASPASGGSNASANKTKKKRSSAVQEPASPEEEEEEEEERETEAQISVVLTGVVEALLLMFTAVSEKLEAHEDISVREGVPKKLCVTVRHLLSYSQNNELDSALIALAGRLPSRALPLVSQNLIKRLKNNGSENRDFAKVILKSLIMWGQAGPVLDMIRDSLLSLFQDGDTSRSLQTSCTNSSGNQSAASTSQVSESDTSEIRSSSKKGKKRQKKTVGFAVEEELINPSLALTWLLDILVQVDCQPMLLKKHKEGLNSVLEAMQPIQSHLRRFLAEARGKDDTTEITNMPIGKDMMLNALTTYLRLLAFVRVGSGKMEGTVDSNNASDAELRNHMHGVLTWTQMVLLPCLCEPDLGLSGRRLTEKAMEGVLRMCHCVLLATTPDNQLLDQIIELCMLLSSPTSPYISQLVYSILSCLYQITQVRHTLQAPASLPNDSPDPPDHERLNNLASQSLCKILESVTQHLVLERDEELSRDDRSRLFSVESPAFNDVFQELTRPGTTVSEVECLHNAVLDTALAELTRESKSDDLSEDFTPPPLCSILLACIKKRATNRSLFINVLDKRLSTLDSPEIHLLHAFTFLLAILRRYKETQVPSSAERSICQLLSQVKEGEMDEDTFRHLKKKLETTVRSWGSSDGDASSQF